MSLENQFMILRESNLKQPVPEKNWQCPIALTRETTPALRREANKILNNTRIFARQG
jgi:hypothetical protein